MEMDSGRAKEEGGGAILGFLEILGWPRNLDKNTWVLQMAGKLALDMELGRV
jgi:hypothetical protein